MLGLGPPLHCIWKIWEKMSKNDLFTNIGFRKKIKAKNEKSGSVFPWGMLQGLKWSISTILGTLFVKKQLLSRPFWNPRWPPLVEIHFFPPTQLFNTYFIVRAPMSPHKSLKFSTSFFFQFWKDTGIWFMINQHCLWNGSALIWCQPISWSNTLCETIGCTEYFLSAK